VAPEGNRPSMHELITGAILRGARLQEECRLIVGETRDRTAELQRTVAVIHRDRAARAVTRGRAPGTFGNRQFDAEVDRGPG
jgi:hypothetical protein